MSKRSTLRTGSLLVVAGILSAACATPPEEDPVLLKLDELDRRVGTIERVVRNESLLQIATELDTLREEMRQLRGQVESLTHESETAATRQRDQYLDLDQRLQSLGRGGGGFAPGAAAGAGAGAAVSAAQAGALPVPGGDDRANYQAALELLKQGRYPQAEAAFSAFMDAFPASDLADNAQYWLGETHYVNRQFQQALAAFQVVLDRYPDSRKLPDALLKVGFCNYELGQYAEARNALESVLQSYPDSTAARLAQQRLEKMSSEGR
jgi:tol-pal system protein YbgF